MRKRCTAEMMKDVTIEIAGHEYTLRTDEDPEYVKQLAEMVTVKMLEIKRDTSVSALDCAAMTALDFADRYMKEMQKKKSSKKADKAAAPSQEPTTLF